MVPRKGATKGGPVGTRFWEWKAFVNSFLWPFDSVSKFSDPTLDYACFVNKRAVVFSQEKADPSLFYGEKVQGSSIL